MGNQRQYDWRWPAYLPYRQHYEGGLNGKGATSTLCCGQGHDMGGQPGRPVPIDPQGQPVFAKTGRLALLLSQLLQAGWVNGLWMNRHARERLPSEDYMAYGYYEMDGRVGDASVEHGLVTMESCGLVK